MSASYRDDLSFYKNIKHVVHANGFLRSHISSCRDMSINRNYIIHVSQSWINFKNYTPEIGRERVGLPVL